MAERTQAEMLADLERALARQDADRELFERPAPVEREFAYGIPGVQEEGTLPSQLLSYLIPARTEVLQPPVTEFGKPRTQLNPITNQLEEVVDRTVTPGVYGETEFGLQYTPIVRGIGSLVDYGQELIESPEARSQFADTVSRLPEQMKRQLYGGADAFERGRIETVDPKTGETFSGIESFLAATGPMAVGRAVSDVPQNSFGIFGSGKGKSGKQAEDTVEMLEEAGLDPAQGWERQSGANTYKAYRSSLDNKVRYEIPMTNVSFKQAFRATEDPEVELGKLLDPDTRTEQRLLAMQGMRIRQINDRDYLTIPGFFDLDEDQLNKYGFTRYDYKAGTKGLQKFPSPVLEQIIDFPELFDEYPQLRSIRIESTPPLAFFVKGSYNPETKTIQLADVPNTPEGRKDMMSTLMHEVQHAVQDIEGLYGGANTGMFEPTGFAGRQAKNNDALRAVEERIEDTLDSLVITTDAAPKPTMFSTVLDFGKRAIGQAKPTPDDGPPLVTALQNAPEAELRRVKYLTQEYLRERAEEAELEAKGVLSKAQTARQELADSIEKRKAQLREMGRPQEQIDAVDDEYRGQAFRYSGSDRRMISLNDALKEAGVKDHEKFAEKIAGAFDEEIEELRPLLKEQQDIRDIESQMFQMYEGNPGEVEARNVQRRFEGVEKDEYVRGPSGELTRFPETLSGEELQRVFPEDTQQMVLPESGLVYSMREGRKTEPSFSIDDPNNPQMELPGMGPSKPLPKDPAERLLAKRDNLRGSLDQDAFPNARARNAVARRLAKTERDIRELRAAAGYPTDRDYAQGGEVNRMRKPVISSGLSGLLRGYTQGPLARVPRETQEPVGMFRGGGMGRFVPELDFSDVQIDPSALPAYAVPAQAAETLAAQQAPQATPAAAPAMPTTRELIAQQRALEQAQLTGNLPTTPGAFLTEGTDVLVQPAVITDYQGRGGTRPGDTLNLVTAPGQTPDEPGMLGGTTATETTTPVATTPVDTTPEPPTPVATTPVATTPVATTPVATTPAATTPVASEPVQTVATAPVYLPPVETTPVVEGPSAAEVLAAEQAAADALAAQEAEQLRIAQEEADRIAAEQEAIRIANEQAAAELLAQQEAARIAQEQAAAEEAQRLAAETLAAQQAAEEAERIRLAEEEAQRIAAEQAAAEAAAAQALADEQAALEALAQRQAAEEAAALAAEQEALAAAEAERIAAAQLAAEQLAAQEAAQLAAEQEAAAQLQAAEQLAAQQEADRIAMEAQLAATPDPDPIYDAPTQGELLQAAETAQAATEDLFTTPTDTGTAIDRGAYGQVLEPVTTTDQQDPAQENVTPAVITEASDGTLHPTPAAAAAYEAELAARQQQAGLGVGGLQSLLNRVNLDVSDVISDYTTGFPASQGMEIQRTYMPFEGTEEERATGYTMPIYKPVAQQTMPSLFRTSDVTGDVNTDAFTAGSAAPGPDSGIVNTGVQGTAPGTFGLEPTQMYQCPNGYVLSFVNGNPICNLVGGGGPGKKRQVPPEVIDITGGMRSGGEVGLNRGIGSFGA